MLSVSRMQIHHVRRFHQSGPFLAGDKKHGLPGSTINTACATPILKCRFACVSAGFAHGSASFRTYRSYKKEEKAPKKKRNKIIRISGKALCLWALNNIKLCHSVRAKEVTEFGARSCFRQNRIRPVSDIQRNFSSSVLTEDTFKRKRPLCRLSTVPLPPHIHETQDG